MSTYDTLNEARYFKLYVIVEVRHGVSGELIWFTDYHAAELAKISLEEDPRVTVIRLYAKERDR